MSKPDGVAFDDPYNYLSLKIKLKKKSTIIGERMNNLYFRPLEALLVYWSGVKR